jgi:hypothetical protein
LYITALARYGNRPVVNDVLPSDEFGRLNHAPTSQDGQTWSGIWQHCAQWRTVVITSR